MHDKLEPDVFNASSTTIKYPMCGWPFADVWLEPTPPSSRSVSPRRYRQQRKTTVVKTHHVHRRDEDLERWMGRRQGMAQLERRVQKPQPVSRFLHFCFGCCCLGVVRHFTSLPPSFKHELQSSSSHLPYVHLFHKPQPQPSTPLTSTLIPTHPFHKHNAFHRSFRGLRALA